MVTSDIPAGLAGTQRPRKPHRVRVSNAVKWCTSGFVTPAILAAAFAFGSLRGDGGYWGYGLCDCIRLFRVLVVRRRRYALGMVLHVFADGKNVRPMRA